MKHIVIVIYDPEEQERERQWLRLRYEESLKEQREYEKLHPDAWREGIDAFLKTKP